jgi:nucleotide-binding universal stress UspA family protein
MDKEKKVEEVKKEETPKKESPVKDSKTKLTIIISILILVILILLGILSAPYIEEFGKENFPNLPFWSDEFEEEMEEDASEEQETELEEEIVEVLEEEEEDETETFTGDVITAEHPTGWSIVEYMDGNGTDMLVSGTTYTGITGLKIFNDSDESVFSIRAVSGIGFAGCGDYAIFSDDNPSYYQEQVNINSEVGNTMEEHDYTNTEYAEFDWFGVTMRRIEDIYYYDTNEGNNYFEPPCFPGVITLEGLTFEDSYGYTGEAYFYGLEDIAQESEYEIVDSILESMEVV